MSAGSRGGYRIGPVEDPDRYVLGAAVASGAEGILYRGSIVTGAGFELPVAIKMLQPRFLPQVEEWRARWAEQVELLRSLQVPGVVRVRDGFLGPLPHSLGDAGTDHTLYLVMNWVDGEPLDEWIRRRPDRDPFDALKLLIAVASALDLMHSGRATGGVAVVHRDVKPSNIIVSSEGTVLVDFGLTRGLPNGQRLSGVTGTPGYLAPEATTDGVYTPASDRFAFGAVSYFVLTGAEPPVTLEPATMRAALVAVPVFGSCREAVDLIMSMVDADRTKRPESLANWVGQLRRSSLDHPLEVLAPEATGRLPQPSADGGKRVPVTDRDRQIPRVGRVRLDGRNLRDRPRVRRRVAVVGLAAALVLAVWHDRIWLATTDRPTATPTTIATATAIPINADLIAGAWSGNAADGAGGHFDVVLDIRTGCGIGQRCGSIHVSSNNCTGDLSLYAINRSGYEFSVNNFSAASGPECSPGAGEYLQPLEKGSLLYTTGYNPGIRAVLKSQ